MSNYALNMLKSNLKFEIETNISNIGQCLKGQTKI